MNSNRTIDDPNMLTDFQFNYYTYADQKSPMKKIIILKLSK